MVYFAICVFVEASTGAWDAPFTSYPDEPAHMVGSVMMRDYLASLPAAPRPFADSYYQHYPFFGVGIWPPMFYLVTAVWLLIAGVGRLQALLVVAAATAGAASVIGGLVRKRAGPAAGFSAGLLFLSLPEVQRWLCAVMADNVATFLCLAAAACLIRYFERATLGSALGFALCASCAILTKYTAWFLCVLPFAALVSLRRFDLLRKRSLWLQPAVIAAVVGPWTLWTLKFITRVPGLPLGSLVGRLVAFSLTAVRVLPPVLAVAAAGGVVVLVLKPGLWNVDVRVLVLFVLGQIAFLTIAPPAGVEGRYVLPVAAAVLVLSFAGWKAALEPLTRRGAAWAFPSLCLALALPFAATHLRAYSRPPRYPVRTVVEAIAANQAWTGKRILVASDLEGPMIAEFALEDRRHPGHWLLRPSKTLASSNWYGMEYTGYFHSPEDLAAWLKEGHLAVIIWHRRDRGEMLPHEALLGQVLSTHPPWLREVDSFDSSAWEIWEYEPGL